MSRSVIVSRRPHPDGHACSARSRTSPATDLGGVAIKAALERAGVAGDQVDYVIMGQVLQAGAGQIPARQAAVNGGIPMTVPSLTINKVCLSGLDAIALADQLIRAGEFDIVVAGGMESMTQAPHLLPSSRTGYQVRRRRADRLDGPRRPVPTPSTRSPMGELTEQANSRLRPDPRGAGRVRRAPATRRPPPRRRTASSTTRSPRCSIPQRKGDPIEFREDEGIRADTTAETPGQAASPAFAKDGTITAGVGLADLRRRLRRRRDERGEGRRAGADLAGRDRRARRRRRPGRHPADAAVATRSPRPASARASTPTTSISSRSTRPSPS